MTNLLFAIAVSAYGLVSALLLAYLGGSTRANVSSSINILTVSAILHALHELSNWIFLGIAPFAGLASGLSSLSLLVVVAFLIVRRLRPKLDVVGAFVVPVALAAFLASHAPSRGVFSQGAGVLFGVHIGSNMVGVASVTVACAFSVAYLLQERQVKARRLSPLFHRLPPLDVLDVLGFRLLLVAVPALTIGVITGHIAVTRRTVPGTSVQHTIAMINWGVFTAVILLRVIAGWRGKRAAIGTIVGTAGSLLVVIAYTLRGEGL